MVMPGKGSISIAVRRETSLRPIEAPDVSTAEHEPDGAAPTRGDDALVSSPLDRRVRLKECVRDAIRNYFEALGEHECRGLFGLVMRETEQPLLEAVLERSGGNQTRAARMLGISPGTLRKKVRQYRSG